jgi:hypothetical protein
VFAFQQRRLKAMVSQTPTQAPTQGDVLPFARDRRRSDGSQSGHAC